MNAEPTRTWEAKSYRHLRQLLGLKISPCGTFAFAGDLDGNIQRWNLANDQQTTLEHHATWVQALAFHPDGRRLFSTDYWGGVACWTYADATPRPLWTRADAHQGWIRTAIATPDRRYLVTAGSDFVLRLWDADTGRRVRELAGHTAPVYALTCHRDGTSLVSGDEHGVLKQWDLGSGRLVRELDARTLWHPAEALGLVGIGGVRCLAFNRAGTELVCGGMTEATSALFAVGSPTVLEFDWARGTRLRTLKVREPFEGFVTSLVYHPDGFLIGAGGGKGGALWFWRPGQDEPFHTVKGLRHIRELGLHADNVRVMAATFEARGQGGNGRRRAARGEYTDNAGSVRIYSMTARPAPVRGRRS